MPIIPKLRRERQETGLFLYTHNHTGSECSWTLNHTGSLRPVWPPWNYLNFPGKRRQLPYRYRVPHKTQTNAITFTIYLKLFQIKQERTKRSEMEVGICLHCNPSNGEYEVGLTQAGQPRLDLVSQTSKQNPTGLSGTHLYPQHSPWRGRGFLNLRSAWSTQQALG